MKWENGIFSFHKLQLILRGFSMKLYEITEEIEKELEREWEEEINITLLEMIKEELQEKAANIVKVIKNGDADIEARKEEIKRLQELNKKQENKMQQFKEYVLFNMREMEIERIPTVLGVISIRKSRAEQGEITKYSLQIK